MSAQDYNTVRKTPVAELGNIRPSLLVAFLMVCPNCVRDTIVYARLNR